MSTYKERLAALRTLMQDQQIDAYIIPSADPHISEYLPKHYQSIAYSSGFTGSAGTLVITRDFAGLWTDARYFVQANEELLDSGFELVKLKVQHTPEYIEWLCATLPTGSTIAFDGKTIPVVIARELINYLQPRKMIINGRVDLLNEIWADRPPLPKEMAYLIPPSTTGESTKSKLERVRQQIAKSGATSHLISSLDDIAWIFNIRGADVKCNPVVLSFAFITPTETHLFIDADKLKDTDQENLLADGIEIDPYESIFDFIRLLDPDETVYIDPKRTCYTLFTMIPQYDRIIEGCNPSTSFKAIKNTIELDNIRQTMTKDGLALTRFFKWFEEQLGQEELTELSVVEKLLEFRRQQQGFLNESFDTIAAYKAHAALPHYKPTERSNAKIEAEGLFLLDSGGQYLTGTTDVTRVIPCGAYTEEEKRDYTLVLKGMIEGCTAIFPTGSKGYQIDAITRKPLWDHMLNYGHGTGHGVGFFLNVHEGPQVLNPNNINVAIEEGMVTSVEPGLYREGEYGIRIENLVLCRQYGDSPFGHFMSFENLTLCYIDTSLVVIHLLEEKQIKWLNRYNKKVYDILSAHLEEEEIKWLKIKTLPI